MVDPLDDLGRQRRPVALHRSAIDELAQIGLQRLLVRRVEPRQAVLGPVLDEDPLELGQELHALGDRQRLVARVREVAEDRAHLLGALQVELLRIEPKALRVRLELLLLDAEQDVVGLGILLADVVEIVRRDDGDPERPRDPNLFPDDRALIRETVVLHLDEVALGPEDVAMPRRGLLGALALAGQQQDGELGRKAARQADQTFGVLGQQLRVHPRPVVEALEVREGDELQQVPVAGLVLGQQGQVVVALLALTRCPVEARARGHVGLHADDRLHPELARGLVEPERPEHRAVIGHGQRRHAVAHRLGEDRGCLRVRPRRFDPGRPVQERVLRVGVEVHEARPHCRGPSRGVLHRWGKLHPCHSRDSHASTRQRTVKVAGHDGPARAPRSGPAAAAPPRRPASPRWDGRRTGARRGGTDA